MAGLTTFTGSRGNEPHEVLAMRRMLLAEVRRTVMRAIAGVALLACRAQGAPKCVQAG
jgi:hypothetical protein